MIHPRLKAAIEAGWSNDTAASDNDWSHANPAVGHCDITALIIQESIGGDLLMKQVFRNGKLSEHHYWNILPDGTEIDLTKSQFDGTETFGEPTLLDKQFFESAGPLNPELRVRLDRFRIAVNTTHQKSPS